MTRTQYRPGRRIPTSLLMQMRDEQKKNCCAICGKPTNCQDPMAKVYHFACIKKEFDEKRQKELDKS